MPSFSTSGTFFSISLLLLLCLPCFLNTFAHAASSHPVARGAPLRVLPLGDSVTYGWLSADQTGYRSSLFKSLAGGNEVEFIGTVAHGDMASNGCECHRGFSIGHIADKAATSLVRRPNIVLLMAGSNDIVFVQHAAKMEGSMRRLLDLVGAICPDAAVLVMKIPPLLDAAMEQRRLEFNEHVLPRLVREQAREGKKMRLLDLDLGKEHIDQTDAVHPTGMGYRIIADAWYQGILEADMKDWIRAPFSATAQTAWNPLHRASGLVSASTQYHTALGSLVLFAFGFAMWRAALILKLLLVQ